MAQPTRDLTPGTKAPTIKLPRDGGGTFESKAFAGRPMVVYFYPKDDTSGCTREALDFTAAAKDFAKLNCPVIGISRDSATAHDKFKAKHGLDVILAADADGKVTEAYGVWVEKSMYGRKYMGIERATFLIDGAGKIARAWRKVKVPGHVAEVLAALKALQAAV